MERPLTPDENEMIDAAWEKHKAALTPLRRVLRDHWLASIVCDGLAKTDKPVCACTVWSCEPKPTVLEAIDAWISHVEQKLADVEAALKD
jgi:hypothetical protein